LAPPQVCAGDAYAGNDVHVGPVSFTGISELERRVFTLQPVGMPALHRRNHRRCQHIPRSFKIFITVSSGPNAKAEQEEMDDVIPWWRQNFVEEFGALSEGVAVDNSDDANFLGGTEADRKLTKERVQVTSLPPPVLLLST
jgi:hypothetical protein